MADRELDDARSGLSAAIMRRIGGVTAADVQLALEDLRWLISTLQPHERHERIVLSALADLLLGEVELRDAALESELWRIIEAGGA